MMLIHSYEWSTIVKMLFERYFAYDLYIKSGTWILLPDGTQYKISQCGKLNKPRFLYLFDDDVNSTSIYINVCV